MEKKLRQNQRGLVSITVVIIIMLILSLIIIAFARLVRREQRQSLDRQLSTQAFYAAEAGINDVINALSQDPALAATDYTDCNSFVTATGLDSNLGDGTSSYSCVLVDSSPEILLFDEIGTQKSQIIPIIPKGPGSVDSLTIAWAGVTPNRENSGCPTAANAFPTTWDSNCTPGILRVDIVQFDGAQSRNTLTESAMGTVYIVPSPINVLTPIAIGSISNISNQGRVINGACDVTATMHCSATITGLNTRNAYLRIKSIYKANKVTISPTILGASTEIIGAQATIDVTGKANDVLRRIQVRVPLFQSNPTAEYALESATSICKRLTDNGTIQVELSYQSEPGCNPFSP